MRSEGVRQLANHGLATSPAGPGKPEPHEFPPRNAAWRKTTVVRVLHDRKPFLRLLKGATPEEGRSADLKTDASGDGG